MEHGVSTRVLAAQLVSARAAIDACLAVLGEDEASQPCTHPDEAREDRSTMGHPYFVCRACGSEDREFPAVKESA